MLGNVTEPLEFTFVFIAPLLYLIYAIIVGIGAVLLSFAGVAIGYIRGTIFDFTIFGLLYERTNWIFLVFRRKPIPWQPVRLMTLNWPCSRMNTVI